MTERKIYLDYLRVFSMLIVIASHITGGYNFYNTDIRSAAWQTFNIYESLTRWGVPVFVMISGALFIGRGIPVRRLYGKYILRLAAAYFFWNIIYSVIAGGGITDHITGIISGHYHMWFIPMIAGLYICVPLLDKIAESEKLTKYFLLISFIFAFAVPQVISMISDFAGSRAALLASSVNSVLQNMHINFVLGYAFYFMLGYYFDRKALPQAVKRSAAVCGICAFIATALLSAALTFKTGTAQSAYYDNFTVNVMAESVFVFLLFRHAKFKNGTKCAKAACLLSGFSFGAYLVHALVHEQLYGIFGLDTLSFIPALSVPAISILVSLISYAISALINQIPFAKKYIV